MVSPKRRKSGVEKLLENMPEWTETIIEPTSIHYTPITHLPVDLAVVLDLSCEAEIAESKPLTNPLEKYFLINQLGEEVQMISTNGTQEKRQELRKNINIIIRHLQELKKILI